ELGGLRVLPRKFRGVLGALFASNCSGFYKPVVRSRSHSERDDRSLAAIGGEETKNEKISVLVMHGGPAVEPWSHQGLCSGYGKCDDYRHVYGQNGSGRGRRGWRSGNYDIYQIKQ